MTVRVQADAASLLAFSAQIRKLHRHLSEGVRFLAQVLDETRADWDDDNYHRYRLLFDEAAAGLLSASRLLQEQDAALRHIALDVEHLGYEADTSRSSAATGKQSGAGIRLHAVDYDLVGFGGSGDPKGAAGCWQRQAGNSCAIMAQIGIVEYATGRRLDAVETCRVLRSRGWYDPAGGTYPADCARVLEQQGVPFEVHDRATFEALVDAIEQGDQVLVGVNAEEIWTPLRDAAGRVVPQPNGGGHAVWVTGLDVDKSGAVVVLMNDSGHDNGAGRAVALEDFLGAWDHFGNFMIVAQSGRQE